MPADDELLRTAPPATLDVDVCRALDVPPEFRAADGEGEDSGPGTMVGHFSVFDSWYEINSWFEGNFLERIAPGAFKRTINNRSAETPVRVLLEHGFDPTVGDKPLGVHTVLDERDGGAWSEVPLFDTSYNRDLAPALAAGAYGKSFRFQVLRDEWEDEPEASEHNPKGMPERTIKEVRLIEEGPTVFPASPATSAGLRSTTDQFYERLRRRDPKAYDTAVARTKTIRTPAAPVGHEDPPPTHSTEPARQGTSTEPAPTGTSEDSQKVRHSEAPIEHDTKKRSTKTMEPMTVEERTARQSEIRARLSEIDAEFNGGELDEERQAEWDTLSEEFDTHERAIVSDTARKDRIRRLADSQPNGGERVGATGASVATPARRPDNIYDLSEVRNQARSIDDLPRLYRDNALRAVEQARFPGAKDRAAAQAHVERLLDSVDDETGTLARRILVTGSPTYDRAFGKAMTALSTNGLTAEEMRALSVGTTTAGGFAVPFQLDPTVILTSSGQVDPLRQIARVEQITTKTWQGVSSAGITVGRALEAAVSTDNSPTLAQPTVTPTRVHGFVPFSIEIDQDWTAMRSEITMMLGEAKTTEEATAFTLGDGTGVNPFGVVTTLNASSHVAAVGEGITVGDLYAVEEALPPRFRSQGQWLANRSIYNRVRQLDTEGGANLWVRLAQGLPPELIGYPAHEASAMDGTIDAAETATNLVLLFGDFSKFLIVDRVGMDVELVPHLFQQATAGTGVGMPTGQRGIYAIWRNSSKILTDNAFRLLKVTTAA